MKALRVLRAFSVPKHESTPNEDRWAASPDGLRCAISDGASVSFDPAPWAEILVRAFVDEPSPPSSEWLAAAAERYAAGYDRAGMEWMQEAAFDKGSFASLLGVSIEPGGKTLRAFAIGDSMLAVIDGKGRLRETYPYEHAEQFDHSPRLFSTNTAENAVFDPETFVSAWRDVAIDEKRAVALLMTDALGRWLLDEPTPARVEVLLKLRDAEVFAEFVAVERAEGRLRRDDSTLVVLGRTA